MLHMFDWILNSRYPPYDEHIKMFSFQFAKHSALSSARHLTLLMETVLKPLIYKTPWQHKHEWKRSKNEESLSACMHLSCDNINWFGEKSNFGNGRRCRAPGKIAKPFCSPTLTLSLDRSFLFCMEWNIHVHDLVFKWNLYDILKWAWSVLEPLIVFKFQLKYI